ALGPAVIEGRAVKTNDLVTLLQADKAGGLLGADAILVVPTLEPSWAVVFPRVGGVVAELGGELSHASILLREARRPAIVNCAGSSRTHGDRWSRCRRCRYPRSARPRRCPSAHRA